LSPISSISTAETAQGIEILYPRLLNVYTHETTEAFHDARRFLKFGIDLDALPPSRHLAFAADRDSRRAPGTPVNRG
jgi:hypothetical protein